MADLALFSFLKIIAKINKFTHILNYQRNEELQASLDSIKATLQAKESDQGQLISERDYEVQKAKAEAAELRARVAQSEATLRKERGEYQTGREQMEESHQSEVNTIREQMESLKSNNQRYTEELDEVKEKLADS